MIVNKHTTESMVCAHPLTQEVMDSLVILFSQESRELTSAPITTAASLATLSAVGWCWASLFCSGLSLPLQLLAKTTTGSKQESQQHAPAAYVHLKLYSMQYSSSI